MALHYELQNYRHVSLKINFAAPLYWLTLASISFLLDNNNDSYNLKVYVCFIYFICLYKKDMI